MKGIKMQNLNLQGIRNFFKNSFQKGMTVRYKPNTTTAIKPSFGEEEGLNDKAIRQIRVGIVEGTYENFMTVKYKNSKGEQVNDTISYVDVYTGSVTIFDNKAGADNDNDNDSGAGNWDLAPDGGFVSFD